MAGARQEHTAIIGGGMLGQEIARLLVAASRRVTTVRDVTRETPRILPEGTTQIIITAQSADSNSSVFTDDLRFVNIDLVRRTCKEAASSNVTHVAYFSTGSVYRPSSEPLSESAPLVPKDASTPYVVSKIIAEDIIRRFAARFRRIVVLRPFMIYGPGLSRRRLLARLPGMVARGEEIVIGEKFGLRTNPIYSREAAEFTLETLRIAEGFDIYNVGGPEVLTLREIAIMIGEYVGTEPIFRKTDDSAPSLVGDIDKMKALGFTPKISFAAEIASVVREALERETVRLPSIPEECLCLTR